MITHSETLFCWFILRENDCFPHNPSSKSKTPCFLSENPKVVESFNSYCRTNILTLKVENVHTFIAEKVIPDLVKKIQTERKDEQYIQDDLFNKYNLQKFSLSTTYKWMKHIGYKFVCRKICYYVDSHDSEENIAYCNTFIDRYFGYEYRCQNGILSLLKGKWN